MHQATTDAALPSGRDRVSVVVLNWNGWRETLACLASLQRLVDVPAVYVVDNGSSDDSVARIRDAAPWARLVPLASNSGFSRGMNAGIAAAIDEQPDVEFVWVLNNDTMVEPGTLMSLLRRADADPAAGMIGSRLVEADGSGRVQAMGGGSINEWLGTTSIFVTVPSRTLDHLVGASLLMRRSLLQEIGGFDERYFFYLEDTDLSRRARRAGWRLAVAADSIVIHRRGATIDRGARGRTVLSDVMAARSSAIFTGSLGLPGRITAIPLRWAGMMTRRIVRGQWNRVIPMTRGYLDGLRIARRQPRIPRFGDHRSLDRAAGSSPGSSVVVS